MVIRVIKPGAWEVVTTTMRRISASAAAKERRQSGHDAKVRNGEVVVEVAK